MVSRRKLRLVRPPGHAEHLAHRDVGRAGSARGADRSRRAAGGAPSAQPAGHRRACPHRYHQNPGSGRQLTSPRAVGHRARTGGADLGRTSILRGRELGCPDPDCPSPPAVACPLVDGDTIVGALVAYGAGHLGPAGARRRRGRPLGVRAGGARQRIASAPGPSRPSCGRCAPDQPALRLQLADRHRLVHPHRPRAGPRAAARVRRLHPLRAATRR